MAIGGVVSPVALENSITHTKREWSVVPDYDLLWLYLILLCSMIRRSLRRRRLHRPHPNYLPGRPGRAHPHAHALLRRRHRRRRHPRPGPTHPGRQKLPWRDHPPPLPVRLPPTTRPLHLRRRHGSRHNGSTYPVVPVQLFLGDCDKAQVSETLKHPIGRPLSAFHTLATADASWRVSVTYVAMTKDYSVLKGYRDFMLGRVKA